MAMRIRDLWSWAGEMSGRDYAKWGVLLFAIKYNLDRLLANHAFHQPWYPWDYIAPGRGVMFRWAENESFALSLMVLSVPFVVIGLAMTLRRLRTVGWPLWLAAMFFAPFLNWLFFLILSAVPSARERELPPVLSPPGPWPQWFRVRSRLAAASTAVTLVVVVVLPLVVLSTSVLKTYGLGLFFGIPFCTGLFATLLFSAAVPRTLGECLTVSLLAAAICGGMILAAAIEGLICLLMFAPLGAGMALLGGVFGHVIQRARWNTANSGRVYGVAWIGLPFLLIAEAQMPTTTPLIGVTTSVLIEGPPAVVWRHVVEFSELPAPTELVFRSGIAYPVRAHISGSGVGAVRQCEFSTGPFVEPITVWDEPRRLAFDVTAQPHPMRELSPYRSLHPPHLDGFFRSRRGEFRLTELPGGRTRLDGTTWYEQRLWPAAYWQTWSDWLVHAIHTRVLQHIKFEAESAPIN